MTASASRPFNLLRWFSLASLLALLPVGALTGFILSHFVAQEALQRDALLTSQFIRNCFAAEGGEVGAANLAEYFDPRADAAAAGVAPEALAHARAEVYEHLETLPDVLLTNLYLPDGRIVWSSNPRLTGTQGARGPELREAFATGKDLARRHAGRTTEGGERHFLGQPQGFYVESYVPLTGSQGQVALVVQVYKEPSYLQDVIRSGQTLVWVTTLAGGVVVYLGLFSIVCRASVLLRQQQRQLVEAESRIFSGEMATALAHSLRNPLATMRSSAELAALTDDLPVRKNAQDIIIQVDFLANWVRELLLYSRPVAGESEPVDLCAVLGSVLASFKPAFERARIRVAWDRSDDRRPLVDGNTSLIRQALHTVISNAVEAMPGGGEMRVELREAGDPAGVEIVISDTGVGMSRQQLAAAFSPFQTTKAHGLGVGLPMLKRAMERFGGFVSLSSAENAGTQVRLHFRTT